MFSKGLQFRNNSLIAGARIRAVEVASGQNEEEKQVRAVAVDKDSFPQFSRVDFPYRSTLVMKKGLWELVEMAEKSQEEEEIEECEGEERRTDTFFHQTIDEFSDLGIISPGDDDPFLRPDEKKKEEGQVEVTEGWFGKSFEDGVYEEEDEEEEVGEQHERQEGDPFELEQAPFDEEISEVEIEGESYRATSSLRELRKALKKCGLGRGRDKEDAWRRLVHHYQHFAENLAFELSRKEFQRMKKDEGEETRGQTVPQTPSKGERQVHKLTHNAYQPWRPHCVAGRGQDDYRMSAQNPTRQEAKAEMPVVSMDFCFSRGEGEVDVEVKEDLRAYQGGLRGGTCLVATDDWSRAVLCIPTPGKGKAHLRFLAEQVLHCKSWPLKSELERRWRAIYMRMLLEVVQQARP